MATYKPKLWVFEGNTLSEGLITDIIDNKHVVAPLREIQEVRNAIKTYDAFSTLNPYEVSDLLKADGLMMEAFMTMLDVSEVEVLVCLQLLRPCILRPLTTVFQCW